MKPQPNLTTPTGSDQGFTLTVLMVGLAISALVMTAIYATFKNQHETYILQDLMASAQQNLRAGMLFMEREIRMAGCDPFNTANASISRAHDDRITFTLDYRGTAGGSIPDGDTDDANENIKYELKDGNLVRKYPNPSPPPADIEDVIAENIGALDFVYLDGSSPPAVLNPGLTHVAEDDLDKIRSVQITMVAVNDQGLPGYLYTRTHSNQQGDVIYGPTNSNINSRAMTVTINARNLGL